MPVTVGAAPAVIAPSAPALGPQIPITIPLTVAVAGMIVVQGSGAFTGMALIEPSGATAAQIELYDGMDATGQLLGVFNAPAGSAFPTSIGNGGLALRSGLFLNVIVGQVRGAIWVMMRGST